MVNGHVSIVRWEMYKNKNQLFKRVNQNFNYKSNTSKNMKIISC